MSGAADMQLSRLSGVSVPRQARSLATFRRLLASAREMLETTEWQALGISEICQHADSSVGSFYARFSNKEALLDALAFQAREELDRITAWCREDGERRGLPRSSRLRQLAAALLRYARRHRGVFRALSFSGHALPWNADDSALALQRAAGTKSGAGRDAVEILKLVLAGYVASGPDATRDEVLDRALAVMLETHAETVE